MAIKVETIEQPVSSIPNLFPRLMKSKETHAIYLITSMKDPHTMSGVCVKNGGGSVVGNDYITLVVSRFTDFNGTITLQNK